jgi:hypothetical protein
VQPGAGTEGGVMTATKPKNGYIEGSSSLNLTGGYIECINGVNLTGLSTLQRWMLTEAAKNQDRERLGPNLLKRGTKTAVGADLYYSEVLAGFYKFPYTQVAVQDCTGKVYATDSLRCHQGTQRFKPEEIGRARYNAACAAISRAASRLERRGLVSVIRGRNSHWAGIDLR